MRPQKIKRPIIVIDGMDGVGKTTQIELLKKRLSRYDNIEFFKFPAYDSEMGFFIKSYLNGNFEDKKPLFNTELDYYKRISMLYTMDRVLWFATKYDPSKTYIFDRYTISNMVHIGAHLENQAVCDEYITWLKNIEYNKLKIPKPDFVIYLTAPNDMIINNLKSTNKTLDIHETKEQIESVQTLGKRLAKENDWYTLDAFDPNINKIGSIESINKRIFFAMYNKFPELF